eukprot:CAMPEP_0115317812 /NCGR_PEP_ID=MMETSP0270-20121206/78862_1 /TAXON_ID=71861 /ORGANISM="Scrippsiella trochoidea, Strain CCMP3099" /LENGTH=163 /DNA_ID=CAMNT_0002737323 /DNA_START=17 /DNA_END=505 /DNA_ORIENTATION=+
MKLYMAIWRVRILLGIGPWMTGPQTDSMVLDGIRILSIDPRGEYLLPGRVLSRTICISIFAARVAGFISAEREQQWFAITLHITQAIHALLVVSNIEMTSETAPSSIILVCLMCFVLSFMLRDRRGHTGADGAVSVVSLRGAACRPGGGLHAGALNVHIVILA